MRRGFTMIRQGDNERMNKPCPTVFTLVRSPDFKQLPTFWESFTKNEELELCLCCEHDSGWHPTAHSVYRFRTDKAAVDALKEHWNTLVEVTRRLGPLAKLAGWAAGIEVLKTAGEKMGGLHEAGKSPLGPLARELGEGDLGDKEKLQPVDIGTLHVLKDLIERLDSERRKEDPIAPPFGGLHPRIVEDGRLLWLCAEHMKAYESRVGSIERGNSVTAD